MARARNVNINKILETYPLTKLNIYFNDLKKSNNPVVVLFGLHGLNIPLSEAAIQSALRSPHGLLTQTLLAAIAAYENEKIMQEMLNKYVAQKNHLLSLLKKYALSVGKNIDEVSFNDVFLSDQTDPQLIDEINELLDEYHKNYEEINDLGELIIELKQQQLIQQTQLLAMQNQHISEWTSHEAQQAKEIAEALKDFYGYDIHEDKVRRYLRSHEVSEYVLNALKEGRIDPNDPRFAKLKPHIVLENIKGEDDKPLKLEDITDTAKVAPVLRDALRGFAVCQCFQDCHEQERKEQKDEETPDFDTSVHHKRLKEFMAGDLYAQFKVRDSNLFEKHAEEIKPLTEEFLAGRTRLEDTRVRLDKAYLRRDEIMDKLEQLAKLKVGDEMIEKIAEFKAAHGDIPRASEIDPDAAINFNNRKGKH